MIVIVPISAAKLHWNLLDAVMHAPMSFFAATDSGTKLNRFSQDMSLINSRLPASVLQATSAASLCLAQLVLVATGSTCFAAFISATLLVLWLLQRFYLHTSRQLRLLDLEQKSPLLSSLSRRWRGSPRFARSAGGTTLSVATCSASTSPNGLSICSSASSAGST